MMRWAMQGRFNLCKSHHNYACSVSLAEISDCCCSDAWHDSNTDKNWHFTAIAFAKDGKTMQWKDTHDNDRIVTRRHFYEHEVPEGLKDRYLYDGTQEPSEEDTKHRGAAIACEFTNWGAYYRK